MKLQYRTREKDAPNGKSGIYFTAHPLDKAEYLENTIDEILYFEDCVVWYDEDEVLSEDFAEELILMNMQLMVIPVTRRLLSEPNRVTDNELKFAFENDIPVMPIVMEAGLEGLYARVFGDLQFLDKNCSEATAIPYTEKFERHLKAVLVTAETKQEVRECFDARIFLSYRKKDRAKAQTLMKLIHENPQFKAVGIWYDEFLVPGEDFNDSIRDEIKNSDLFVMNVTPNLVNEENFIRDPEYKWAKERFGENHKTVIIPAQTEYTDQNEMRACFEDIRDNVDAYSNEALCSALLPPIKEKINAFKRNARQKYLLGLAYFHGIDMEKDTKTGVELITQAAHEGELAAKKKLVVIYSRSLENLRDFDKQIYWQKQVIEHYKELCIQQNVKTSLELANEQVYLGDDLINLCRWEEASKAFEDALASFNTLLEIGGVDISYYNSRILHIGNELGIAYGNDKKSAQAITAYTTAINVAESMNDSEKTVFIRNRYAQILSNLGCQYLENSDTQNALKHCLNAVEYALELAQTENDAHTVYTVCTSAYHLGCVYEQLGEFKKAETYFSLCVMHAKENVVHLPNIHLLLIVAEGFRKLSDCSLRNGDADTAIAACKMGEDILKGVFNNVGSPLVLSAINRLEKEQELIRICKDGELGNIRPRFVKLADDLASSENADINALSERANAHKEWARACKTGRNYEKAEKCYVKAIKYLEEIVEITNEVTDIIVLNRARIEFCDLNHVLRRMDCVIEILDKAEKEIKNALKKENSAELESLLAATIVQRGSFYRRKDSKKALECFLTALKIYEDLACKTNKKGLILYAIECYIDVSNCYLAYQDDKEQIALALQYSQNALKKLEEIYMGTQEEKKLMEKCLQAYGVALNFSAKITEAISILKRAYDIQIVLAKETGNVNYTLDSARTSFVISGLCEGKQRKQYLKIATDIINKLCREHPENAEMRSVKQLICGN